MANEGGTAGNRQINANTGVTIGLVITIFAVSGTAIFKAGEVLSDLSYIKADLAEMKQIIRRLDRQQRGSTDGERSAQDGVQPVHVR